MPITIAQGAFTVPDRRSGSRRDIEDGGAVDADQIMIQFVCSTGGNGTEHDPDRQPDDKVRPEHAALHGTVWRIDDANAPVPPLDYGCRCAIRYVSKSGSFAAAGVPESPSDPIASPSAPYRDWLDKHADGWKDVADAMAKAPAGEELAAGYQKAVELKMPGDRRAIVRMVSQVEPELVPAPPAVPPAPPATVPAAPVAAVPPRPAGLPAGLAQDEGLGMQLAGSPPASASAAAAPPRAPLAPDTVEQAERWIASRSTERNVVIDASGAVIEAREGGPVSAPISAKALLGMRGGVVTHNHPLQASEPGRTWYNPPSQADIALALTGDLKAVRAVTPNGLVYQVGPPPGGWTGKHVGDPWQHTANLKRVRGWLKTAVSDPVVAQRAAAALAANPVAPDGVGLLRHHLALERLAELGKITYTVGRYAT